MFPFTPLKKNCVRCVRFSSPRHCVPFGSAVVEFFKTAEPVPGDLIEPVLDEALGGLVALPHSGQIPELARRSYPQTTHCPRRRRNRALILRITGAKKGDTAMVTTNQHGAAR